MKYLIAFTALALSTAAHANDKPVDFWVEDIRLFGIASGGAQIDHDIDQRRASEFTTKAIVLDRSQHKVGDHSLQFRPAAAGAPERFGFVSSLWGARWRLDTGFTLRLWLKTRGKTLTEPWEVRLVDSKGKVATASFAGGRNEWQEIAIPLSAFNVATGFDWTRVGALDFKAKLGAEPRIWFDGVRFEKDATVIGVTDKSVSQRVAEARQSRNVRAQLAFQRMANEESRRVNAGGEGGRDSPGQITKAFAMMMANVDLDTANAMLRKELEASSILTVWSLHETPFYIRFYDYFSAKSKHFPGRLSPEVEALLLETLWERNLVENDINKARQSTWWMEGSENHDLQAKASSIAASRIFMNEPAYANRTYPNHGFGAGYHYGHASYYGKGVDPETRHGGGRANLNGGQGNTPAQQHAEWVAFFKEYLRERARKGFFLEQASPTYSKHTLSFLDLAIDASDDPELERLGRDFMTLYWADWAQTSIDGVRGGPKTRHHRDVGGMKDKQTADLVTFYLGGPGDAWTFSYWNLLDDYELPDIVWNMILDREEMGSFVYHARGIGEEKNEWPRPLGMERSTLHDTESRFLKSTYVTPDYTLGTQMDHPGAVHSHLSIAGRWHGMTVAGAPNARLLPVGRPEKPDANGRPLPEFDVELMMHTVHDKRTLILQQSRRWFAMHPEWFPADPNRYNQRMGLWFGNDWDAKIEEAGWVFVRKGDTYAAVRPVLWDEKYERTLPDTTSVGNQIFFNPPFSAPTVKLCDSCYGWNEAGTIMTLPDNYTVLIIEAGSKAEFGSFEAFKADTLDNAIALYKTVVPGFHVMTYTGSGTDREEITFNAGAPELPMVGGRYVDYAPAKLFDSPTMQSEYDSGIITLRFGDKEIALDFTQ